MEKSIADDPDFIQVYDYSTEPQGLKYEPGMYKELFCLVSAQSTSVLFLESKAPGVSGAG